MKFTSSLILSIIKSLEKSILWVIILSKEQKRARG
jgi:hypothetical protein